MQAKLQVKPVGEMPYEVEIANTATIGRTKDNTISFPDNPHISRQHAIIRCHNAYQYQIMDLGSRNGTFVNGRRVIMPVVLENGALIRITNHEILFEQTDASSTHQPVEVTIAATTGAGLDHAANVAIMVCDIRGFSTMSEILPEDQLARTLGEWFREAGNLVQSSGGTVDKFIGDAVLAYWDLDNNANLATQNALQTGLALHERASMISWPKNEPFRIAVALHYGQVTCGNIGLVAQRDATIIGDAVNTTFRIESMMKPLGKRTVLSGDFRDALARPGDYADLGEHQLKGKNQLVRLYSVEENG